MCKVNELCNSKRRISIILKNGDKLVSPWFDDDDTNKNDTFVNCTENQRAVYNTMLQENGLSEDDVDKWYISRYREEDVVYISDHAMQRLKQRNGWNKKTALRMIKNVYDNGQDALEVKGYIASWMKQFVIRENKDDYYIIFGEYLYVFNKNTLVTVLHIPKKNASTTAYKGKKSSYKHFSCEY